MKKSIALATFLFFINIIFAQDSTQWKISLDVEGSGLHLYSPTDAKEIRIDNHIFQQRRFNNIFRPSRIVSDNPNFHFATYLGLKFNTSFQKKYQLQANIFAEHRGASYASNDLNNIVFFPNISFLFKDTFSIFQRQFEVDFKFGNIPKHQVHNGLKIYNINVQAVDYSISYRNFFYRYNQIADLSFGIGLELEEYFNYAIGYKNKQFKIEISREWNSLLSSNPIASYQAWNLSGNYFFNQKNQIYFQLGSRYFDGYNFKENGAVLLGADLTVLNNKTFTWLLFPKIRFYTANYNVGHYNPNVIYRKLSSQIYSNTVGRYLYPLRNYYYDFDQWAIFTEYTNMDVLGLGMKSNFDWRFYKNFFIKTKLETLSIRRKQKFYNNLFYEIDFFYVPVEGLEIGVKMTNKTYNLDAHFQTFYMMREPLIGAHIRLKSLKKEKQILRR